MITKSQIQFIRSLSQRGVRESEGLFIAEGDKLIEEIASSQLRIHQTYTTNESFAISTGCDVEHIPPSAMERISQLKSANTSLAIVEMPQHSLDIERVSSSLSIALDRVQNPGNLGTIIRIADWFGVRDILASHSTVDCFNPKVVQASMGAITRVRVHYCNLEDTLLQLNKRGVPIYGTYLEGESIYSAKLSQRGVIVMGSEGSGISPEVGATVSRKLLIPPYPEDSQSGESLNVAVATAIVCSMFRKP